MSPRLCLIKAIKIEKYMGWGHLKKLYTVWKEGVGMLLWTRFSFIMTKAIPKFSALFHLNLLVPTLADFCIYITESSDCLSFCLQPCEKDSFLLLCVDILVCQQSHSENVSFMTIVNIKVHVLTFPSHWLVWYFTIFRN